jgi:anti-sigma factor ChrR (cupin superfamily)
MSGIVQPVNGDLLIRTSELPWVSMFDGIAFRLLRASAETGVWTVVFRCEAGSSFPLHRHYGAGEYYVISGRMQYRGGDARTGDYGYEPLGAVHELTSFPERTELLFTNHGPVAFLDRQDGSVLRIVDHEAMVRFATGEAPA